MKTMNILAVILLVTLTCATMYGQGQSQMFSFPSWDDGLKISQQDKVGTTTPSIKRTAIIDTSLTLYFNSAPGDSIIDVIVFTNKADGLNGIADSLCDSLRMGVKVQLGNNGTYALRDTLALDSLKKAGSLGAAYLAGSSDSDRVARNLFTYLRGLNRNARFNCLRVITTHTLGNAGTSVKGSGLFKPFTYSAALITRPPALTPPREQILTQEKQKIGGR